MAYKTNFVLPDGELRNTPLVIHIDKDKKKFGRVQISKTKIEWLSPNQKKGTEMSWEQFAAIIAEHGKRK